MKIKVLPCKFHKVDSNGNVYSRWIQYSEKGKYGIQTKLTKDWRKLNLTINPKSKYMQLSLHGRMVRINRLIAINFIPNPNAYPEVQHKNGIRTDNRISNLKWGNQKQNADDRRKHGNSMDGIKNPLAKLNDEKVREIRLLRPTHSLNQLKNKYNVSQKLILLVCQKKIWKHVK